MHIHWKKIENTKILQYLDEIYIKYIQYNIKMNFVTPQNKKFSGKFNNKFDEDKFINQVNKYKKLKIEPENSPIFENGNNFLDNQNKLLNERIYRLKLENNLLEEQLLDLIMENGKKNLLAEY